MPLTHTHLTGLATLGMLNSNSFKLVKKCKKKMARVHEMRCILTSYRNKHFWGTDILYEPDSLKQQKPSQVLDQGEYGGGAVIYGAAGLLRGRFCCTTACLVVGSPAAAAPG